MNDWTLRALFTFGTSSAVLLVFLFIRAWRKSATSRAACAKVYENTDPNYPPPMRRVMLVKPIKRRMPLPKRDEE